MLWLVIRLRLQDFESVFVQWVHSKLFACVWTLCFVLRAVFNIRF